MSIEAVTYAWSLELPPSLKLVLLAIASEAGSAFTIEAAITTAANLTGFGQHTIEQSVDSLIADGIIARHPHDHLWLVADDKTRQAMGSEIDKASAGYVYVIRSGDAYKIGRTSDPKQRLADISASSGQSLRYEVLLYVMNMYSVEKALHRKFQFKRLQGEWFDLSPDDIYHIRNYTDVAQRAVQS